MLSCRQKASEKNIDCATSININEINAHSPNTTTTDRSTGTSVNSSTSPECIKPTCQGTGKPYARGEPLARRPALTKFIFTTFISTFQKISATLSNQVAGAEIGGEAQRLRLSEM